MIIYFKNKKRIYEFQTYIEVLFFLSKKNN